MYSFILQILIMVFLGVMIYLAARKVPSIADTVEDDSAATGIFMRIEKFLSTLPLEKTDFFFSQLLEKFLRKSRLMFMRLDNQMAKHLEKFKNKMAANGDSQKKLNLFEKPKEEKEELENNELNSDNVKDSDGSL